LKPAILRPQALRDQQNEVRYHRAEAGARVAVQVAKKTDTALDQIELQPGLGSPALGKELGIPGLKAWKVSTYPLMWFYFERKDHLDVVRLLGERQDLAAVFSKYLT
jgi:toxin ParE1/3/4